MLFNQKFSNLDEKFSEQKNEIRNIQNNLNVQFDEVKKEIREQGCIYDKKLSEIETRLGEIELENEKVINKLKSNKDDRVSSSGNDNLNNGVTSDNNDNTNKNMVLKNDCVEVDNDNEIVEVDNKMFVYNESESRKNLQVEWMQVVDFSRNVVVGGEEMASREYLEEYKFTDKFPLVFCALHRWCHNDKLISPACLERECVVWYDGEKCFERERKRELEIFKVKRNYDIFNRHSGIKRTGIFGISFTCSS